MYDTCFYCLSVDTCPELLVDASTQLLSSSGNAYGSVANMTCAEGYHVEKNNFTQTIHCMEGGIWSEEIKQCQGQLDTHNILLYNLYSDSDNMWNSNDCIQPIGR